MALVWDFVREIDSGDPGNTTSYYDTWSQAFYTAGGYIMTQIGLLEEGHWDELVRDYPEIISDLGYSNLDIEHHQRGAVYGSAQHSPDVVFLRYSYMLDISNLLKDGTWQMQPDNPIKSGSITLKNTDNELFGDNTFSLFLPGNKITLRFYAGNSIYYTVGVFFIEDSPFGEIQEDFKYSGRNHIGFYMASQSLDENVNYSGTLTEIFTDLLLDAGLDDTEFMVESTASTGTFAFQPTDNFMSAIIAALEIADWYMDDQPTGKIVIGSASYIRANAASTSIYSFDRDSEVFSRGVTRNLDGVFSRVCVNRNGTNPLRIYADVPYYSSWHLTGHRTFYQNVPDDTEQVDMERIATDLATAMQYSGIVEQFDSPFRPWLQIGDVGWATGGEAARLVGIITAIQHDFGDSGFYTGFTITSGGEVVNPEDPNTIESRYLGRMGGANRQRRLLDYLTGNISSSPSAGSSPVGAVAYQAAVSGGYIGDEQTFNEFLALVAEGAVLPQGGLAGQILAKIDGTDYNVQWIELPSGLPEGGLQGQFLMKSTDYEDDFEWADPPEALPEGGTTGQVLAKTSDDDYDVEWTGVINQAVQITNQNGSGALKIWAGTQAEYDAIAVPSADTIYFVEDEEY